MIQCKSIIKKELWPADRNLPLSPSSFPPRCATSWRPRLKKQQTTTVEGRKEGGKEPCVLSPQESLSSHHIIKWIVGRRRGRSTNAERVEATTLTPPLSSQSRPSCSHCLGEWGGGEPCFEGSCRFHTEQGEEGKTVEDGQSQLAD